MQDSYIRKVRVRSVYDGDTCRCDVDLGYEVWLYNVPFRLYGINTPEIRGGTAETKAKGREARDWLRERIMDRDDIFERSLEREKYGRWLSVFYRGGVNVNEQMVDIGLAKEYMKD